MQELNEIPNINNQSVEQPDNLSCDKATGGIPNKRDAKGRLLPGHGGGPGRNKGQSLKEYWKQRFAEMTPEEKEAFTKSVSEETIWRMAEGNPQTDTDITSGGDKIQPIYGSISKCVSNEEGIQLEEEDKGFSGGNIGQ